MKLNGKMNLVQFRGFELGWTQRHHVRNDGGMGVRVKSIRHIIVFHHCNYKKNLNKTNAKRHPIVFGFKAGLLYAGEGGAGFVPR